MNAADSQRLFQHIRRLAGDPPNTPCDGELLRRYLERRDDAAFAALVRRHGQMVFSVCQSVLRQRQDAEDAFQATFLILARKAATIRGQDGLGGWLQRVAYRIALKARADQLRRQEREAKTARSGVVEPSSDELSWGELRAILHAELAALPERFRAPLVLCYLEGLTQEEAAHRLGWTAASVKGRLQRGREKLRRRLERRGVALTAALAAAMTGQALAETAARSVRHFTTATATTTAAALAHAFLH
ncbi:MAG: RNA polymerase sigma factor [Gemmataceae bacterium]